MRAAGLGALGAHVIGEVIYAVERDGPGRRVDWEINSYVGGFCFLPVCSVMSFFLS